MFFRLSGCMNITFRTLEKEEDIAQIIKVEMGANSTNVVSSWISEKSPPPPGSTTMVTAEHGIVSPTVKQAKARALMGPPAGLPGDHYHGGRSSRRTPPSNARLGDGCPKIPENYLQFIVCECVGRE